ncbi:hypothetical protein [uncultured Tenacibaculum sp.]|uniref:hypothetical protein n=1 Tax=uncultured Tenacibaculum sp. TaxID=174713 RepID=UPI002636E775|nr:hypothetical protein [uncultured Tenacibaculum sp.]
MKRITLVIILIFTINSYSQDGSDIKYVRISELDNSYIGKFAHLDFFRHSFGGTNFHNKDLSDTVKIKLNEKIIEFKEHRVDNGFNNWFSKQYLESIETLNNFKIRVSKMEIKEIKPKSIIVNLHVEYRNGNGVLYPEKSEKIEYEFPKSILTEILIKT